MISISFIFCRHKSKRISMDRNKNPSKHYSGRKHKKQMSNRRKARNHKAEKLYEHVTRKHNGSRRIVKREQKTNENTRAPNRHGILTRQAGDHYNQLNDNNNIDKLNVLDADKVMLRSSRNELERLDNEISTNIKNYRNFKFLPFISKIRPRWKRKDGKKTVATFNVNGEYVPLISSHIQTL